VFGSKQSAVTTKLNLKKLPFRKSPFEIFSKIYEQYENAYILESAEGEEKLAQHSFLGFDPYLIVRVKNGEAEILNKRTGEKTRQRISDPLLFIKRIVTGQPVFQEALRFVGGAVGYVSYDAFRYWERLPEITVDDTGFPDIEMGIFDDGILFDHKSGRVFYYYQKENRVPEIINHIEENADFEPLSYTRPKSNITKEQFEKAVIKAKEYINSGDIFQVVLSKRYESNFKGSLYMYFLKMGKHQIVGSSPEMLVRVERGIVETFPIAGTRPHTKNQEKNKALAQELLTDPKERAEHVMLVDLARNDLGKVSEFGSVHVPEFMRVYHYSHVQHIVSRVVGKLRRECDCYDALKAVFPAGTVSGAPKLRAMEIIEELEPVRRGPYAGAVGYFSYNGNADFAITIRTLVAKENKAYIQVGAGIVADSIPEKEWFETEHKAEALMKTLETSSRRGNV